MRKQRFTTGKVAAFECEPGKRQTIHWDAKTPGLGLRVTSAGAKSYIFETRLHGKTLRVTIGDVRTWTLGKAQAEATRYKLLTDQGIDPRQVRAEQDAEAEAVRREAKRKTVTLGEAWAVYIEARRHKWSEHTYSDHMRVASQGGEKRKRSEKLTTPGPLAGLLPVRLTDLSAEKVAAWLRHESAKRPTVTGLSFRLLRAFIRWAESEPDYKGLIPADVYRAQKVREAVPKARAKANDCLQREHLPAWFAQVRKLQNPVIAAYLQALLLTGARREEMAGLKWDDVDFQWRALTLRDKVEGHRTIPLTPYLSGLLAALPRRSGWVFSSPTAAGGRIADPRIAHNHALETAGLPHVTLHGLRRRAVSILKCNTAV